jgi:hypothetical protein
MAPIRVGEGADESKLVRHPGKTGKELADFDARNVCRDGSEFASNAGWSIGLEIKEVEVGWPPGQVNIDDCLVGRTAASLRFHAKELAKGEPACSHASNLEEVPPGVSVTVRGLAVGPSEEIKHDEEQDETRRERSHYIEIFLLRQAGLPNIMRWEFFTPVHAMAWKEKRRWSLQPHRLENLWCRLLRDADSDIIDG